MCKTDKKRLQLALLGLWHGRNYGAVYTSYALQQFLKQLDYVVTLLDIADNDINKAETTPFRQFLQEEGATTLPTERESAYSLNNQFDAFVVGSDLVWSHNYLSQFFFLDFVKAEKRRVGYSCSMSTYTPPRRGYAARVSKLLKRFDGISFRENTMQPFFKKYYSSDGKWVIDPVFLLGQKHWEHLAEKHVEEKQPHIATYILDPTESKRSLILDLHRKTGLSLSNIIDIQKEGNAERLNLPGTRENVTLYEWLYNISTCDYFVTDSYHGLCFALIFNKPFICICNTERGAARFESLLGRLALTQRLIHENLTHVDDGLLTPVRWDRTNQLIKEWVEDSRNWLEKALTTPRTREKEEYLNKIEKSIVRKPTLMRKITLNGRLWFHKFLRPVLTILRKGK